MSRFRRQCTALRRVHHPRLSCDFQGRVDRPGAYRSRHVHRLRAVRAVLRTRLHRSGLGGGPMSSNTKTVLLCGVGGQGTILAADLLARAAEESGLDVKVSEIHGMAQRGGAVTTVVRFGDKVQSMIADSGLGGLRRVVRNDRGASQPSLREGRRQPLCERRVDQAPSRRNGSRLHA